MFRKVSEIEPAKAAVAACRVGFKSRRRASGPGLVKNTNTVDRGASERRLSRRAKKRQAAFLVTQVSETKGKRLSECGVSPSFGADLIQLKRGADGRGFFSGVMRCGQVWTCPDCSARISAARAEELNDALTAARHPKDGKPLSVAMLTLTVRHARGDDLAALLAALKDALRAFGQAKGWRGLDLAGSVTATEVTHGKAGWHPHLHRLVFGAAGMTDAALIDALQSLRAEWARSCAKFGLDGSQAPAFQVQGASDAGQYVAKFGAAEEIALSGQKVGRGASRTPWQLLADATEGDKRAGALFVEYARSFAGRRQLVWSRGLKALFGIDEVDDETAACEPEAASDVVLMEWPRASAGWKHAARRMCALLDAVEFGGSLEAALAGPTDAERWRMTMQSACVIISET